MTMNRRTPSPNAPRTREEKVARQLTSEEARFASLSGARILPSLPANFGPVAPEETLIVVVEGIATFITGKAELQAAHKAIAGREGEVTLTVFAVPTAALQQTSFRNETELRSGAAPSES